MAHTYSNLQPSLSSILSGVVADVSTALLSEIGVGVKYKHNSFTALMNELIEDSNSTTRKNDKYPLIALIQPYRAELGSDSASPNVTFDLVIVTNTTPTKTADDREEESYNTYLRPIYAELISQLSSNQFVSYRGMMPKHRYMDIYHLGDERGNKNGYTFPDFVDAILIEGMELKLYHEETCTSVLSLACTPIHEIEVYHSITGVTFDALANTFIGLTMTDVALVEDTDEPTIVEYSIDWGDGTSHEAIQLDVNITHSVANHDNGIYIGTITSDLGATYQFEYEVSSGRIASVVYLDSQDFDYGTLDCADSFEYPLSISLTSIGNQATFSQVQITEGGGNVLESYDYTGGTNESEIYEGSLESLENTYIINITTANANLLENTTILNIKII